MSGRKERVPITPEMVKQMWELRQNGLTLADIGRQFGFTREGVRQALLRHKGDAAREISQSLREQQIQRIREKEKKEREGVLERKTRARQQVSSWYERAANGESLISLAREAGKSPSDIWGRCARWARNNNKPWPLHYKRQGMRGRMVGKRLIPSLCQQCYELAASGRTWKEINELLDTTAAATYGRLWAKRKQLPWPLFRGVPQASAAMHAYERLAAGEDPEGLRREFGRRVIDRCREWAKKWNKPWPPGET